MDRRSSYFMGAIIGSSFVGPVADAFSPRIIFLICVPFAAQVGFVLCVVLDLHQIFLIFFSPFLLKGFDSNTYELLAWKTVLWQNCVTPFCVDQEKLSRVFTWHWHGSWVSGPGDCQYVRWWFGQFIALCSARGEKKTLKMNTAQALTWTIYLQGVLLYALSTSALFCVLAFYCLPRTCAKCNLYLFLSNALYIQIPGAMDFFYTADEACLPGGL